jgi:endoglucanase
VFIYKQFLQFIYPYLSGDAMVVKFYRVSIFSLMLGVFLTSSLFAGNLLQNSQFNNGTSAPWSMYTANNSLGSGELLDGQYVMHINAAGDNRWDIQFRQQMLTLEHGHTYTVKFKIRATKNTKVYAKVGDAGTPYAEYWNNYQTPFDLIANEELAVEQTFVMTAPTTSSIELGFHLGNGVTGEVPFDIAFDDIYLEDPEYINPSTDLLQNGDFSGENIAPWSVYTATPDLANGEIQNGSYVYHINNAGTNRWDIQLRQQGLVLENNHQYNIRFRIRATKATAVYVKVGDAGAPYNEYWNNNWTPYQLNADEELVVNETFTMSAQTTPACELGFHLGNGVTGETPFDVIFDDISLCDPEFYREPNPELPKPAVRLNQTGYYPKGKKRATIVNESTTPITWLLKDKDDTVLLTGTTTVFGKDSASRDFVHIADFSAIKTIGEGYTLSVGINGEEHKSHPFTISKDLYAAMKYQALAYFYHNRSGIALEMPYAGSIDYTRPAGHPEDIMRTWPNSGQEDYTLTVNKGWYDAGDHGKYVVNGGISVWTMMNQYERAMYAPNGRPCAFADGKLSIPENNNGVPDILDESRWEMEMLLSMQVPKGLPYAGMVHHKGHDENWTGIPLRPDQDPMTRYLCPVSTAATLNLAATAAQSARLWARYDMAFASECLVAALKAWDAALKNPDILNSTIGTGGGLYDDTYLQDEFYWAAAELYISTGKSVFKQYLKDSPHYLEMPTHLANRGAPGYAGVFTWDNVQGLGTISLALVPNMLGKGQINKARQNIISAADQLSLCKEAEGYNTPLKVNNGYEWGSNSFVVNDCIVSALAYEFTKMKKYLDDVTESMDYLMGRNGMDKSYISGYGERPLQNPHHRFWAYQANPNFPGVPAGVLSGGPNSALQDPYAQGIGLPGSAFQKCYVDHFESWSTNEITINWNAPLAWVTAFLDEKYNR